MNQTNDNNLLSKSTSWQMFNEISQRYDFLNHVLSFGLDIRWRKQLGQYLKTHSGQKILDLATGTADVLISLCKNNPNIQSARGLDMAVKMIEIGRTKIAEQGLREKIMLQHGDAHQIPFEEKNFDAVTIAFGIRNMTDPVKVLSEMHRVLKPSGRALILEFSLPENQNIRAGHLAYLRHMVPCIGAVFTGRYKAYKLVSSFFYINNCDVSF